MNKSINIATRFGEALEILGTENENVVVLDADLSGATKTNIFAEKYPERFFDMGIAEQDMIGTAAGLSTCGKIPFAASFAVFAAGRTYDQIRASVCYPKLNVKICGTHAGITVGEDGATHQMLEDIGLMRGLPNMTVLCPSDDISTRWAVEEAAKINGPVYIRLSRAATPVIYEKGEVFSLGKAVMHGTGTIATIFATGVEVCEALKAQELLAQEGINIRVVDMISIKPIDEDIIVKCAAETDRLISIEDHSIIGGLGTAISEVLTEKYPARLTRMGMKDCFGQSGKAAELQAFYKLDADAIIAEVKK
jgi:transketolase